LYNDGTLVYEVFERDLNRISLLKGQLSTTAIREVMHRLVGDNGFFDLKDRYLGPPASDAGYTKITVWTAGEPRSVVIDGSFTHDLKPSEVYSPDELERLAALDSWLSSFDLREMGDPDWKDLGNFSPDAMTLFSVPDPFSAARTGQVVETWPFPEIDLESVSILHPRQPGVVLEGDLAREVYEYLLGSQTYIFSQGDTMFNLTTRPHLPYESEWREAVACP